MNLDQIIQEHKPQPPTPISDDPFSSPQIIKQSTSAPVDNIDEYDSFVVDTAKKVTSQILTHCAEDRAKATEIIERVEAIINSQHQVIQGGTISRLLHAIQTRAEINDTAVKMVETLGKILSARKSGGAKNVINNTNAPTSTSNTLINILQEGLDNMGSK